MDAFGQDPSTQPGCGSGAILDPYTGQCHCVGGQIRDPYSPDDCVDPGLRCVGANTIWSESAGQCIEVSVGPASILPPSVRAILPSGASPSRPLSAGVLAGWTAILGAMGVGGWLIYQATVRRRVRGRA